MHYYLIRLTSTLSIQIGTVFGNYWETAFREKFKAQVIREN